MTKKSLRQAEPQVLRKLGPDTEKCQTLRLSKHRPTTADDESVWPVALEIARAAVRLSLYALARIVVWAVLGVLFLSFVEQWVAR